MNKKTKKRILGLALVFALFAIVASGTIAYFTDKDDAKNTFTVGGVKIKLIEKQRVLDDNGKATIDGALEDFTQNKLLMPIVGSAQGEKDQNDLPKAPNYVDKVVTVENTGKSPALIRAYFAIPSALDDGYDQFNAGKNVLHFNFGRANNASTDGVTWDWGSWNYFETVIDGVPYNVYFANYKEVVAPNAVTTQFVSGVYLDQTFDIKTVEVPAQPATETTEAVPASTRQAYYAFGKELTDIDALLDSNGNLVVACPVYAIAVQADGFDVENANDAFDAAFGEKFNPWGGTVTNYQ